MKYWKIWQNNSGGVDEENEELGVTSTYTWYPAWTQDKNKDFWKFFDKLCELDMVWYCECCGERWSPAQVSGPFERPENTVIFMDDQNEHNIDS